MRTDAAMKRARMSEVRRRFDKLNGVTHPPSVRRRTRAGRYARRRPVNDKQQLNETLLVIGVMMLACICWALAGRR
jgi:hypothetical protein